MEVFFSKHKKHIIFGVINAFAYWLMTYTFFHLYVADISDLLVFGIIIGGFFEDVRRKIFILESKLLNFMFNLFLIFAVVLSVSLVYSALGNTILTFVFIFFSISYIIFSRIILEKIIILKHKKNRIF